MTVASISVLLLIVGSALIVPFVSYYKIDTVSLSSRNQPPSISHIFGTDNLGRDLFVRVLVGTRVSLFVAVVGAIAAGIVGVTLGATSGYFGGMLDQISLRVSELFMSFPAIILLLVLATILGPNIWNIIVIFAVTKWPRLYRLVRAQLYSLREEEYVEALRALNARAWSIIFRHLLPNATGTLAVWFTVAVATGVIQEAGLSFLGLGVQAPTPSLGNLLAAAQSLRVLQQYPWQWLFPGAFVGVCTICINFVGDWLRDIANPRTAARA